MASQGPNHLDPHHVFWEFEDPDCQALFETPVELGRCLRQTSLREYARPMLCGH